jgi:hypothetical protein
MRTRESVHAISQPKALGHDGIIYSDWRLSCSGRYNRVAEMRFASETLIVFSSEIHHHAFRTDNGFV